MSLLRYLMLLSLVVWVGGIIFFAIMAPTAFHLLPTRLLAGTLVGNLLAKLHWIAIVSGIVYLLSSLAYNRITDGTAHLFAGRHLLVGAMLALTLLSQFWITPRMLALRAQVASFDTAATPTDIARVQFDALHVWSTRIEVTILLLGLIVLYLTANALDMSRR
ncbi:MAG TPA: DUF4149 domain-containing protein [Candidatus Sulfotelmatobacter sp.]|nr:DUF4149 domain-containing protein [Candidatus Sulfotelmatobacter sp.]